MRPHHTKNKGDLGVAHAIADLADKGWRVLLPMTEHEAFDLVAYRDGSFLRVQVRYRALVDGCIPVTFTTSWADRHGTHTLHMDRQAVDVMCVYCPDTKRCYYVDPKACGRRVVSLRVVPTANKQRRGIRWADDYVDLPDPLAQPGKSKFLLRTRSLVRIQQGSRSSRVREGHPPTWNLTQRAWPVSQSVS